MTAQAPTVSSTTRVDRKDAPRAHRVSRGIPLGSLKYELKRPFRRSSLIFTLALPMVLYIALFRTGPSGADLPHGNFAMWMTIGIAIYGGTAAATATAVSISVEQASGWMRTIRMTPLGGIKYVLTKVLAAVMAATIPVTVVGVLGFITGARGTAEVWLSGLLTAWLGSGIFAALGIALGLALRPEVVMHIPGLTITAFAFIGNLFIPLSGTMLSIGQVTPMFGVAAIARHALTDGYTFSGEHTSLGWAIFNALAWMIGFIFWASRRFARSTGRK